MEHLEHFLIILLFLPFSGSCLSCLSDLTRAYFEALGLLHIASSSHEGADLV